MLAFAISHALPSPQRHAVGHLQHTSHRAPRRRCLSACAPPATNTPSAPPRSRYISRELARKAQNAAVAHADGDREAVASVYAAGVMDAFERTLSRDDHEHVFIVCGTGFNGLVGMHFALALEEKGYRPFVYYVGTTETLVDTAVVEKLKGNNIPLCDFVPSTLDFYYDVIVDALLGVGFDGGDIWQAYWRVYDTLCSTELPIVSIDIPSGWDLNNGPRSVDFTADTFLKPQLLVSLGAPKNGSKVFAGSHHYVARGTLPEKWAEEHSVELLPPEQGQNCALLSSNPDAMETANGEVYGKAGLYGATLYTKTPRRKWVGEQELEDHPDYWDELD